MAKYTVRLRYYVGDPLEEIRREDVESLAETHGVEASFQKVDDRSLRDGMMREETLDKAIEEVCQDVISIETDDEKRFRRALGAVYEKYRSPRTPYSFWGSSPEGERIARALADETGGGW